MKILVVMPVTERHKEVLRTAAPSAMIVYADQNTNYEKELKSTDVIIGNIEPSLLGNCKKLKLLQLNSAGTDGYTAPGVLPEKAVLTNASGAYGLAISEHMMGMLLSLIKKIDVYRENMNDGRWEDAGAVTSIYDSKTLVVGLGDIGNEFAKRMNAMGSIVSGVKRRPSEKPDYIDRLYSSDQLSEALAEADIVANCLPGTTETQGMFNKELFSAMKQGAIFMNVGRGTTVVTDDLVRALRDGKLGGACLDVTDPEPLNRDHPLWHLPNVIITPHVSGGYHLPLTHDKIINIAARNIWHLRDGSPFENVVDLQTGYRK